MTVAAELRARQAVAVAHGVATREIFADHAENAEIWIIDGKRFIDYAAGIAVVNTGHRHPRIMQAIAS